jgi:hypothetical protein
MHVGGDAHFHRDTYHTSVTFERAVSFLSAVIGVDALFSRAEFKDKVEFDHTRVEGRADFERAIFAGAARASFIRVRLMSGGDFSFARFGDDTDFSGAVAARDIDFSGALFAGRIRFNEARFESLFFGRPTSGPPGGALLPWMKPRELADMTLFRDAVDFRGLAYERIHVQLDQIFSRIAPFDRQPYSRLEAFYHGIGDDSRANDVYLERRRVERKNKFRLRAIHGWGADWLYKVVANYGVRPFRLVGYSLAILWFGAVLFSKPGALEPKERSLSPGSVTLGPSDGRDVSLRYFLPIDSPLGSNWVPGPHAISIPIRGGRGAARVRPDWYATFLRMAGTALVGLGLAAVTGLLRRIAH